MTRQARPVSLAVSVCSLVTLLVVAGLVPPASAGLPVDAYGQSDNVSLVANLRIGNLSDIAFWGDLAAVGTGVSDSSKANDGFVLVDISDPTDPVELSRFTCAGAGYDVSMWEDLVILSSNKRHTLVASCSSFHPGFRPTSIEADFFVVDISKPHDPRLIAAADTPCDNSHTHTLVPDVANRRLVVWNSGGFCVTPVEISLPRPVHVKVQEERLGPWGDTLGSGSEGAAASCHDITVFLARNIAACATSPWQSVGPVKQVGPVEVVKADAEAGTELWDLTDPMQPRLISRIQNPAIEHQHSTAFSWDGDTLVIGEEKISTLATDTSTCGTESPLGALWFYDISDPTSAELKSWYQLPRPTANGYCSAHNFSVVPIEGRDILTAGFYGGGTTVVDFTDATDPREIAYFHVEALDQTEQSVVWSAYWYNGYVYASNFSGNLLETDELGSQRGLDVLQINDSIFKDAANLPYLNVQTQMWNVPMGPPLDRGSPLKGAAS